MIAPATTIDADKLVTGISLPADIEKLKAAKVGKFITFKVTDVPYLLYNGLDQTKGHYVCSNTFRGEEEYGTNWKVTNAHMCERTVSLKLMKYDIVSNPPYMKFAQTLAQLHFPADSNPEFVSPLCKQGPQLFLSAGLRGTVVLVDVDQEKITDGETFRTDRDMNGGRVDFSSCSSNGYTEMTDLCKQSTNYGYRRRANEPLLSSLIKDERTKKMKKKKREAPKKKVKNVAALPSRRLLTKRRLDETKEYVEINSGTCRSHPRLEPIATRQECQDAFNDVKPKSCRGWDGESTCIKRGGDASWDIDKTMYKNPFKNDCFEETDATEKGETTCSNGDSFSQGNTLLPDVSALPHPVGCYTATKIMWTVTINSVKMLTPGLPRLVSNVKQGTSTGILMTKLKQTYSSSGDLYAITTIEFLSASDQTFDATADLVVSYVSDSDDTDYNGELKVSAADITNVARSQEIGRHFNTIDNSYKEGTSTRKCDSSIKNKLTWYFRVNNVDWPADVDNVGYGYDSAFEEDRRVTQTSQSGVGKVYMDIKKYMDLDKSKTITRFKVTTEPGQTFDTTADLIFEHYSTTDQDLTIAAADITSVTMTSNGLCTEYGPKCSSRNPCMCKIASYETCLEFNDEFESGRKTAPSSNLAKSMCYYKDPVEYHYAHENDYGDMYNDPYNARDSDGKKQILKSNYRTITCTESHVVGGYGSGKVVDTTMDTTTTVRFKPKLGCSLNECCEDPPSASSCTGQTPKFDSATSTCRGWTSSDCSGGSGFIDGKYLLSFSFFFKPFIKIYFDL